jgi:hypothetical protein
VIAAALRYAALGVALFAIVRWLGPPLEREPGAAAASGEERLVREALALGLHESDAVVRDRLVRNLRFLGAVPDRADEALFRDALALGLHTTDVVVRRRLVQRLELAALNAARESEPGDAELQAFLEAHPERFATPARARISQVYRSRERRGPALERDARALVERLRRERVSPAVGAAWGDPSLLPARTPLRTAKALARDFGPELAEAVLEAPLGEWSGPWRSSFGLHAVFVHEREPARAPALDEVRAAVRDALVAERARERLRAAAAGAR